jgi:hypothetical protein
MERNERKVMRQGTSFYLIFELMMLIIIMATTCYGFSTIEAQVSKISFAASTKEAETQNKDLIVFINSGFSCDYPYGYDVFLEMTTTEDSMRGLGFRLGQFKGRTLYEIDCLFHSGRYGGQHNWWIYKGFSLFHNDQRLYLGFPLGIQTDWGGFIDVFPICSGTDSYLMGRFGVKIDPRLMFDLFSSLFRYGVFTSW